MRNLFDLRKVEEMKSGMKFGVSTLFAMACAVLIGCSGGGSKLTTPAAPVTYTIGGTVSGLTATGLVLENAGGNSLTVSANASTFSFSTPVPTNDVYSVTVATQPAGESCVVSNGNGTATANVTSVAVKCTALDTIGGTVSGLVNPGLVLQDNGGDRLDIAPDATSFSFPTPLANGGSYIVTVLTQPLGETCLVSNGSGTASGAVTNVAVACTQQFDISGTITGLNASGLVLQDNGGDNLTVSAHVGDFTFPTPIASGGTYGITVLTQPAAENCTVIGGSGTATSNVVSASVVCVGDWTWTAGSSTLGLNGGQSGIYGTLGTSAPANLPGGRSQASIWTDASGKVWLFGGNGKDANGIGGQLNDLWKFDPAAGTNGQWTWINGSAVNIPSISSSFPPGAPGVYGTLGTASPTNVPGGREQCASWKDAAGNLWLFGGIGIDVHGVYGYLNDLWKFDTQASQWAWMGGSNTVFSYGGHPGVYGTLGTGAPANIPGGRYGAVTWADASGNFFLFGGSGVVTDPTSGNTVTAGLNDLWEYTPGNNSTAGEWIWVGGSSTVPPSNNPFGGASGQPGVYGTLGSAASTNIPGGRQSGISWTDTFGNFWLFGGLGVDAAGNNGYLNDLWEYTPGTLGSAGQWTWQSGANTIDSNGGQPGNYGFRGTTASSNVPGARFSPSAWVDPSGNFWIFGGQGYDWTDTTGLLNDLWKYTPGTTGDPGKWTWMGGSDAVPPPTGFVSNLGQSGVYGTLGIPAPANTPGGRLGAAAWVDASGNLRLLGGQGDDSLGTQGYLNDLWQYQP